MRVLFVGYATMDRIGSHSLPGGAAGAMSINAARLGIEAFLFAPLSQDEIGLRYLLFLQDAQVHTSLCSFESPSIPTCDIPDVFGLGSTRVWKGNGAWEHFLTMKLSPEDLRPFDAIFLCNAPKEVCLMIAKATTSQPIFWIPGPKTVHEPKWISLDVLHKTFALFANEEEAPILARHQPLQEGVSILVTTLGERGGIVETRWGEKHHYTPPKNIQVVDTTGAGDSLALGFLLSWLEHKNIESAIQSGIDLSTQCIQKNGAVFVRQK